MERGASFDNGQKIVIEGAKTLKNCDFLMFLFFSKLKLEIRLLIVCFPQFKYGTSKN